MKTCKSSALEVALTTMDAKSGKSSNEGLHREARVGEAHLAAAAIHEKAAKAFRALDASKGEGVRLNFSYAAEQHEKEAAEHKSEAANHAKAAGGYWDESKHPRDENGKFT
jgi:hypothetical protein